jgi:3-dehydroquinate synthase
LQAFDLSFHSPRRRATRVRVGEGVIDRLVDDLASDPPGRRLVVISDDNVAPLHAEPLLERLRRRGLAADLLTFPPGESRKSRRTKRRLEDAMLELGAGRDTAVIAVGGGVTGDLAGFVAATWHRGVPVVQVPTSLLSMADAALGGKTAVNLPGGKNLVGSVHQPWGVYADIGVLETLPEREYRDGFAEIVKSATIADRALFRRLESAVEPLRKRAADSLTRVIEDCMRIKGRIVTRDEHETGRRAVLNFGHTMGHALEAVSRYRLRHGRAVAIGMDLESRLAVRLTGFPAAHAARVRALLEQFRLPTRLPARVTADELIRATRRDKKNRAGEVHYALPRQIGRMLPAPGFTVAVEDRTVRAALAAGLD